MSATEQQARVLLGEPPEEAEPRPPRPRGSASVNGADRPVPRSRRAVTATEITIMKLRGWL